MPSNQIHWSFRVSKYFYLKGRLKMKLDCGLTDIDAEKIQDLLLFGIPQLKKLKLQSISLFLRDWSRYWFISVDNQLGDKGIQLICRGIRRGDCHYDQLAYVNFSSMLFSLWWLYCLLITIRQPHHETWNGEDCQVDQIHRRSHLCWCSRYFFLFLLVWFTT